MSLRRLRSGELVAIVGAAVLVVASSTQPGGWASFGWLGLTAVLVAIVVVGAMLAATVAGRDAVAIVLAVVAVPLVFLAVVAVLVRLVGDAGWGSGAALIGALAMLGGVWRALADERTDTAVARAQTEEALSVRGEPRDVPPRGGGPS